MRARLASAIIGAVWLASAPAFAETPAAAFAAVRASLALHDDGYQLDNDPSAPALLAAQWKQVESAAIESMAAQPGIGAADLKQSLSLIDKDLTVEAVRLDAHAVLVSLKLDGAGDVFIVGSNGGGVMTLWRMAEAPVAGRAMAPLQAWAEVSAPRDCRAKRPDADWADCGEIWGGIGRLPDGAAGERRFWVRGVYAQQAGETESGQLSFWTWDGLRATPRLVRVFGFKIELDEGPTVAGDRVSLPIKEDYRSFLTCGACAGRQRVWTFRLTGDGVRDLGKQSLVPELDLVDTLFQRTVRREPLGGLATAAAARAIRRDARQADRRGRWPMGTLNDWMLSADRRNVCVATDWGGAVTFTLARRRGRLTVTSAKRVGDGICSDVIHWPGATSGS